jgi:hypothetical protein
VALRQRQGEGRDGRGRNVKINVVPGRAPRRTVDASRKRAERGTDRGIGGAQGQVCAGHAHVAVAGNVLAGDARAGQSHAAFEARRASFGIERPDRRHPRSAERAERAELTAVGAGERDADATGRPGGHGPRGGGGRAGDARQRPVHAEALVFHGQGSGKARDGNAVQRRARGRVGAGLHDGARGIDQQGHRPVDAPARTERARERLELSEAAAVVAVEGEPPVRVRASAREGAPGASRRQPAKAQVGERPHEIARDGIERHVAHADAAALHPAREAETRGRSLADDRAAHAAAEGRRSPWEPGQVRVAGSQRERIVARVEPKAALARATPRVVRTGDARTVVAPGEKRSQLAVAVGIEMEDAAQRRPATGTAGDAARVEPEAVSREDGGRVQADIGRDLRRVGEGRGGAPHVGEDGGAHDVAEHDASVGADREGTIRSTRSDDVDRAVAVDRASRRGGDRDARVVDVPGIDPSRYEQIAHGTLDEGGEPDAPGQRQAPGEGEEPARRPEVGRVRDDSEPQGRGGPIEEAASESNPQRPEPGREARGRDAVVGEIDPPVHARCLADQTRDRHGAAG